jgi:amidophosphoribosyltransferase
LIAANHSVDEIREFIGADSLGYLSLDGLRLSVGSDGTSFCEACLTGHYAAGVIPERDRRSAR